MELRIISDVHGESGPLILERDEKDLSRILIIAGDMSVHELAISTLRHLAPGFRMVLWVPGNHEYEGANVDTAIQMLKTQVASDPTLSNVKILDCETIVVDDVRFIGATLWTDMNNEDWFTINTAKDKVSDYTYISKGAGSMLRTFSPRDAIELHYHHKQYIDKVLHDIPFTGKTVVITHNAPSFKSMDPIWQVRLGCLDGIFASHLDTMVGMSDAKLWIHGHIHSSKDYFIGDTRVVCNPRGNAVWGNPEFNPNLVIDV